jgi:hypothetical protein
MMNFSIFIVFAKPNIFSRSCFAGQHGWHDNTVRGDAVCEVTLSSKQGSCLRGRMPHMYQPKKPVHSSIGAGAFMAARVGHIALNTDTV